MIDENVKVSHIVKADKINYLKKTEQAINDYLDHVLIELFENDSN